MQMEPWRKRGFVPDSDEDDGFDSLDSGNRAVEQDTEEGVDLEYISLPVTNSDLAQDPATQASEARDASAFSEDRNAAAEDAGSQELVEPPLSSPTKSNARKGCAARSTNESKDVSSTEALPNSKRVTRTYAKRRSATEPHLDIDHESQDILPGLDHHIWDIPSSPPAQSLLDQKARGRATFKNPATSVRHPKHESITVVPPVSVDSETLNDSGRSRSSSPDELAFVLAAPRKVATERVTEPEDTKPREASDDDSPLSSPPSSLESPPPELEKSTETSMASAVQPPDVDRIGPFPEDSHHNSTGMFPPVRRSFRERNAIQLHPYALEMAKYQRLMQERGIKPVRVATATEKNPRHDPTDESQEQDDYDPAAIRSSPTPEEFIHPNRSSRREENGQPPQQRRAHDNRTSSIERTSSQKRRKRFHSNNSNDNDQSNKTPVRPQVVVNVDSTPNSRIPQPRFVNSPPYSGGLPSSIRTRKSPGNFRLPSELMSPPTTTLSVESDLGGNSVTKPREDQHDATRAWQTVSLFDKDHIFDSDESEESGSDHEETAENRLIRDLQKKTRGVLPASWVRLNAEQSSSRKTSQGNRQALSMTRTEGKGVAKKITRNPHVFQKANPQSTRALFDFAEFDDTDEEDDDQGTSTTVVENNDARDLSRFSLELSDNFFRDEDAMEDNRIDYMMAPVSRKKPDSRVARGLKRVKSKESAGHTERRLKKARLQRQTRLTDSSYGGRPTKSSSTRASTRRSILDVPDIVNRPRKEQPQFLRIAARRARSRKDQGRQSPTRKFVQLSSRQDTLDANQTLRDWKRGTIPRSKSRKAASISRKRQVPTVIQPGVRNIAAATQTSRITKHFEIDRAESFSTDDRSPAPNTASVHGPSIPIESAPSIPEPSNHTPAAQLNRAGNQWIVQRRMPIISLRRNDPRPAPTSLAAPTEIASASKGIFSRSLTLLNRKFRREKASRPFKSSLTLDRYITDESSPASRNIIEQRPLSSEMSPVRLKAATTRRRAKKQNPTRLNIDSEEYLQKEDIITTITDDNDSDLPTITHMAPARNTSLNSGGVFNWQSHYPIDFGVLPLRDGTFFHESTFIGSGEVVRSLNVTKRDLDTAAGFACITTGGEIFQWGPWNETTSTQIGMVFAKILESVQRSALSMAPEHRGPGLLTAVYTYRSMINYVTENLSFIDPVDRISFISRTIALVSSLQNSISASLASQSHAKTDLTRIACYNAVLTNQLRQIAIHDLVDRSMADNVLVLLKACATDTLTLNMSDAGLADIRRFWEEHDNPAQREAGIREHYPAVEAYIIFKLLFRSSSALERVLNELLNETLSKNVICNDRNIANLESGWRHVFSLLPLNDIDDHGIVRRKNRFQHVHDNWKLVKRLVSPVLTSYETCSTTQPISFNVYCRALFQRCHRLINCWAWRECRLVLDTLYDFFAQNKLYNLKLEESRGSPSFLDQLDQNPSLDLQPGEPCFHTLLKIIASGLQYLSERYDKKKIRNFAWRLLPNHGRVFPKEKQLLHEDLDALRNHHDLLCTLYWVIPAGLRFRIEIIKDIVHPASSHNETCAINLRAWTRLVRFKLSTDEDTTELEPFANWHAFFLSELRQQHALARKEGESLAKTSEQVSRQLVEANIADNQRPIENLLSVALHGMQSALERAPSLEHAFKLIAKTPFDSLLGLFNPRQPRVNAVVSDALKVIVAYIQKAVVTDAAAQAPKAAPVAAAHTEDDSQEFDDVDWDESLDNAIAQPTLLSEGIDHVQNVLYPVVFRLLSNCFGEDHCPEDKILLDVVDCWTSIAQTMVSHQLRQWDNYLDPVSVESWASLRGTVQTRKFTPCFLARCIEKDHRVLNDSRILVTGVWIACLVERTSMLKFQNHLTEAMLNCHLGDPLLQNLPFAMDKKSGRYMISLEDLIQRRVSLLSSVLLNMREDVLKLEALGSSDLNVTKQDYSEILKRLMAAMRSNYQELGNGPDGNAHGAYVDFVHRIIRFLQELTSDIRPVDPFFTDPAVFPLPTSDPRYVVAKLKRYEPRLSSSKELQTLAIFIQSIVERATMDGQHDHLISQLHSAMKESYESGMIQKPTLRAVLLQCVFPAYIEPTFNNTTAWLLSLPLLKSVSLVFNDLLFSVDTMDPMCVASVLNILTTVFHSVTQALRPLSNRPRKLQDPTTMVMLTVLVDMISSSLVIIDFIDRATEAAENVLPYIEWFRGFFVTVSSLQAVPGLDAAISDSCFTPIEPPSSSPADHLSPQLAIARRFAFEDHRSCLRNWSFHEGKYYYTRPGHDSKLVTLEPALVALLEDPDAARLDLQDAVSDFVDRVGKFNFFSE